MASFRLPELSKFDAVARDSRNLALGRIVAAGLAVLLVYRTLGPVTGLVWGGAQLTCEILIWISTVPLTRGAPGRPAQRLAFMAATVANSCVWLTLSLIFWHSSTQGSAFTALLIWGCLLVNATSFAFRSPAAFAMFATPVTVVLTLTPMLSPRFQGPQQTMVCVGAFILAAYAILSARRNMVAARQLEDAHEALERERAAAESANLAKSAFLATMSHEIRTPLNGVLGMAQAMARDDLPSAQRERLAVIRSGGETLLCLLNDLLDLSRIEAGRLELEDGVVDVAEIAASAQAAFTALAADKDIHLELEVSPAAQGCWRGDPTRVRQVLYNLVSNAVKFTARGSVRIVVAHDGHALSMAVSDTGPGIPAERLEALFEKFVQADASTTRQFGGSGLGLAICRELAALMGGQVTAVSREGEGSTFTLVLPLARAERRAQPRAVARAQSSERSGLRVLAAEDNPMNQQVLSTLLGQLGVDLVLVGDGAQAVEASMSDDFDLILMDVQMPVMDGPTATRTIRARERMIGRRTPILALTANAMAHHEAEYRAAGMDGLVAKPIQLAHLIAEMDRVLSDEEFPIASV
ncbi:MAG: ATP-binding protein, partial [Phenylobacterium sp.]